MRLSPGLDYFVILASDGIWDVMEDCEATAVVASGLAYPLEPEETLVGRANKVAHQLVDLALARGSSDNSTVALMVFQWG